MPARFDAYRMKDGKTPLSERYFNPVFQDLDMRLVELEALRMGWLDAVSQVSNLGIARINEVLGGPMEKVDAAMETVDAAMATLQQALAELPDVVLAGELQQQTAALQQQIAALQQAMEAASGADPLPPVAGQEGKFLATDGETQTWESLPPVTGLQRGAAKPRQLLGVSAAGAVVGMAPLELLSYEDRAQLRTLTEGNAIVRGLGLFTWEAGSTELDDDETCFATAGGAWVLTAAGPDAVRALWQAEVSAMQQTRFLSADFSMSVTSMAGGAQVTFIVALVGATNGDSVYVTPDRALPAAVSTVGVVTQPGTVTVSVRNVSASTDTLTPGTWKVLVIQHGRN